MAKNWNVREFAEAYSLGGDARKEAIFDAGRRFPLTSNLVSSIMATGGAEYFKEFLAACPDWMTMRKIEGVLKDGINVSEETEPETVTSEETEAPKTEKKPRGKKAKAAEAEETEEEKPAKKAKKEKPAKKAKKPAKVEEPEETEDDDDDEWEI